MMRMFAWLAAAGLICAAIPASHAQFVSGDWVERGAASIQAHRTTPVSFLVLDAEGKLAPHAEVRVEQLRHAFTLGFVIHDQFPQTFDAEAKGWRAFNAVSLEGLTSWRQIQPDGPNELIRDAVDTAVDSAAAAGLRVRWGALVSADTFDLPEWVVPLRGAALLDAVRTYARRVASVYGESVVELDVAEKTLDHDRLSPAMLRLLAIDMAAHWPTVSPSLRFAQALSGARTFDVIRAMDGVLKQRLGVTKFTIDHVFSPRPLAQDLLEPALERLVKFDRPIVVGSLEIGGTHSIEAAVNTETVLRTLFAEPLVTGVYFSGLFARDTADPSAALFDGASQPTSIAHAVDRLFRETWWSDITLPTNPLGQARTRVYLGEYRVTATLPDGSSVTVPLRLWNRDETPTEIILMPVAE